MDCSRDCAHGSCGCNGGLPSAAFRYVIANGGIDTEKDYNYTQVSIPCDTTQAKRVAAKIEGYKSVPPFNESQLLAAVVRQPVSVGINAQGPFQFYHSGVLDAKVEESCACDDVNCLDHAVLVVGFGTDHGVDYWTVKNSWGPQWGESGYARMARNVVDGYGENSGLCGIAVLPVYPTVAKGPAVPLPAPTPPHPSPKPKGWCNNCGEDCEWQCQQIQMSCDSQSTTAPKTCYCKSPTAPCGNVTLAA